MPLKTRRRKWIAALLIGAGVVIGFAARLWLPALISDKLADRQTPRAEALPVDPSVPALVSIPGVPFPAVHRFHLKNGLQVLVLEDHRLPQVTLRLTVPAGRIYESSPGIAEMTNSLLAEGTATHSARQITDALEQRGATVSWSWNREDAPLQLTGLSEHTVDLLGYLSDMAVSARFPADRLERTKQIWSPHDLQFQGARYIADSVAAAALYGKTPYGKRPSTAEDIQALRQTDLTSFYHRYYRPNNAILAISGDVDTAKLQTLVEKYLGKWTPSPDPAGVPAVPVSTESGDEPQVDLIDWRYDTQAYVSFQCLTVSRNSPDFFPLMVANRILGGVGTSRLGEDLRENRGFTYGAMSSFYTPSRCPGIWCAAAVVPAEQAATTIRDIEVQMERLRNEPVSAEELTHTKNDLIGNSRGYLESPATALAVAVAVQKAGLPARDYESYTSRIAAVTSADVQRVAAKYLPLNRVHIILVGPRDKLDPALASYHTVRHYGPTGSPLL